MAQLPLALKLDRHASFASFVTGQNAAAVAHVEAVARGQRGEPVWIWGAVGSGKTHLLAAASRAATENGSRAMYLPLGPSHEPGLVSEHGRVDLLLLDDIESVAGSAEWESALFEAFDARLYGPGRLIVGADRAPRECEFVLADLKSRALAAAVYRLEPLNDEALLDAIERQASMRGLVLDRSTAAYLLQRVSRELDALTLWLDKIDQFALAEQRRVTIPLVREVIGGGE